MKIALPARPEPIEIDREQTAVLLVDMQNAFASPGGMLDPASVDHEYWPVMIEDATMPAGSPEIQRATVYNVTTFFGWVSTASEVAVALQAERPLTGQKCDTLG